MLGAAVVAPGVPGPALVRRVEWGVGVFRARCAGHLVLSGGSIGPPPPEAHLMRQIALDLGVDEDRIVVEDTSRNTFENAVYTGAFIRRRGWRRVVVVTDAYHLRRALYIFRRLGLAVEGAGVPRTPAVSRLRWLRLVVEEWLRHARAAQLFWVGAHKRLVARVWEQG
ncbi:MAG: YdcF family protein [Rhodospirillales bacterium]